MQISFILMSLLPLGSMSQVQEEKNFPDSLTCIAAGDCIQGLSGFCDASSYFPVTLDKPGLYAAEPYDPSGVLSEEELQGKVKLDFSEGDQYSFYFFDAVDMNALTQGSIAEIKGTYEDGFDWTNGYNTRARFQIECKPGAR